MSNNHTEFPQVSAEALEARVIALYLRRETLEWSSVDEEALIRALQEPTFARTYASVKESLGCVERHLDAPELVAIRRSVLRGAGRYDAPWSRIRGLSWVQRGLAAAAAIAIVAVTVFWNQPASNVIYATLPGEQRTLDLEDGSRVAIDASTRMTVRYSDDARMVSLIEGQAQFIVAPDPRRPFRVEIAGNVVTAIGTSFNVDYIDETLEVTMVEGKVSVAIQESPQGSAGSAVLPRQARFRTTDIVAGQSLLVSANGDVLLKRDADVEAAIAWRQGKLIFKGALLADAIKRVNRYSKTKLSLADEALGERSVSGVFDVGDVLGFVEALEVYMAVNAEAVGTDTVRLSASN